MKKQLFCYLAAGLLLSNVTQASSYTWPPTPCDTTEITLQNAGISDCVLKNSTVLYGTVTPGTQIPEVLLRDQSAQFSITPKFRQDHAAILLTYQCGDEQAITFLTHRIGRTIKAHQEQIRGTILESKAIQADFDFYHPFCDGVFYRNNPTTAHWTLTSDQG